MAGDREQRARSFGGVADLYERSRPEYPLEAVEWLTEGAQVVLDVGAGTGKLTRGLVAAGRDVLAVEPDTKMAARLRDAVPGVHVIVAPAEAIPVPDASYDAVVAGQAYHWFDPARALPEIARVLRPGGRLGLVWNDRDDSVPWIAQLTALLHAREEMQGHPRRTVEASGLFGPVDEAEFAHEQRLDRETLLALVASRSNVAIMDATRRDRLLAAAERLFEEAAQDGAVVMRYVTQCFRAARR